MPTCSPLGPTSRTSGTRIRSLMRGSALMGPPRLHHATVWRTAAHESDRCDHRTWTHKTPRTGHRRGSSQTGSTAACHRGAQPDRWDRCRDPRPEAGQVGDRSLHLRAGHTGRLQPVVHQAYQGRGKSVPEARNPSAGRPGHRVTRMSDAATGPSGQTPDFDSMTRDIADVPAVEVITTVAVHLMSSAAVNLGLAEEGAQHRDLDEARKLIHALAGLVTGERDRDRLLPRGPAAGRPQVAAARLPRGVRGPGRAGPGPRREVHRPGLRLRPPAPGRHAARGADARGRAGTRASLAPVSPPPSGSVPPASCASAAGWVIM